ncbi:unnamed protein product [Mycena citricolor]|uniref:Amidohydrolase 3 domain-containing protein n=1 Tax=Mycena citricolor TaxID=2018698 RepID=A0AAD2Q4V8_9AGAR|nr:unnamed protein product [Mycena citricolor]
MGTYRGCRHVLNRCFQGPGTSESFICLLTWARLRHSDHPGSDSSQFKIMDPMMGYYATVTRLAVKETSPRKSKGWIPKQIRTRIQALRGMTNDSAYATISESDTESIELGKRPDFVVFSPDTMHRPAGKITETRPLTTAVDGRGMSGRKL